MIISVLIITHNEHNAILFSKGSKGGMKEGGV